MTCFKKIFIYFFKKCQKFVILGISGVISITFSFLKNFFVVFIKRPFTPFENTKLVIFDPKHKFGIFLTFLSKKFGL